MRVVRFLGFVVVAFARVFAGAELCPRDAAFGADFLAALPTAFFAAFLAGLFAELFFEGFPAVFFAAFFTVFFAAFLAAVAAGLLLARFFAAALPGCFDLPAFLADGFLAVFFGEVFFDEGFLGVATTNSFNWSNGIAGQICSGRYCVASASSPNTEKTSGFLSRL